uniref:Uncharacterized protein n=1 Tax=Cacopsylla melanoneura TaxID=428564 RepID=A0A8D9DTG7_9HEMI
MDPNDYLKNYPQPLHLHPNSMLRFNNDSQNNSFRHNSPRSRDRPYFNRGGHNRRRHQNSDSQYSSDGSNFNDSSSPSSMNSPYWRQSQSNHGVSTYTLRFQSNNKNYGGVKNTDFGF